MYTIKAFFLFGLLFISSLSTAATQTPIQGLHHIQILGYKQATTHRSVPLTALARDAKRKILVDLTKRVKWTSSDTSIATIDTDGQVKALKPDKKVIMTASYGTIQAQYPLDTTAKDLELRTESVDLQQIGQETGPIPAGSYRAYVAILKLQDGAYHNGNPYGTFILNGDKCDYNNVKLSTEVPGVVRVSSEANGISTCSFYFKIEGVAKSGGEAPTLKSREVKIQSSGPVLVTLEKILCPAAVGQGQTIRCSTQGMLTSSDWSRDAGSDGIVWSSNNVNIATVVTPGVVTGVAPGQVVIAAEKNGVTKTVTITVGEPSKSAALGVTHSL